MTRAFPESVVQVATQLTTVAGSYLHSVTSGWWDACEVCGLPVDGYDRCPQCEQHVSSGLPLADRVGLLVYAPEPASQAYKALRGYKEQKTRSAFEPVVEALLAVGLRGHYVCASKLADISADSWAVVPSTRGRTVLSGLVRGLARTPDSEVPVQLAGDAPRRTLSPGAWQIAGMTTVPEHVVVIDDAWVTGASAQSLAAALKSAGADQVSVLAVGRVLSSNWRPNLTVLRDIHGQLPYDWRTCPWTRDLCPAW